MENYFNYFTEIEECYRQCRNTPSLLSPLDWALVESWREAGIPLPAVLAGIERAFAKFQKRPRRLRNINSLAYCTQQVRAAAEEMQDSGAGEIRPTAAPGAASPPPPFSQQELRDYLDRNALTLGRAAETARAAGATDLAGDLLRVARDLRALAPPPDANPATEFEALERKLSALEDILNASLLRASSVELLEGLQAEADRALGPHRRKMSAAQIESLQRQFVKKRLLEHYRVPRLSLFYL